MNENGVDNSFIRVLNESGIRREEGGVVFMSPFTEMASRMLTDNESPTYWSKDHRMAAQPDGGLTARAKARLIKFVSS